MGLTRRQSLAALLLLAGQAGRAAAAGAPDGFARNFDGLRLLDQEGRGFSFERLAGRVLLVNFIFTGCSAVCPVQTRALVEVLAGLPPAVRAGVHFVSVSLDPLSDTPAVLKAYAQRLGADLARWSFVTGPPGDIDQVSARLRLFRPEAGARRPDDHTATLWLVDARGRLMQRLQGNPPEARRLKEELAALQRL